MHALAYAGRQLLPCRDDLGQDARPLGIVSDGADSGAGEEQPRRCVVSQRRGEPREDADRVLQPVPP